MWHWETAPCTPKGAELEGTGLRSSPPHIQPPRKESPPFTGVTQCWGGAWGSVPKWMGVKGCVHPRRDTAVDMGRAPAHTLLLSLVLGCSAAFTDVLLPGPAEPVVNVAVVFGGTSYPLHIRSRLSPQSFLDMPLEIHPITVVVNNTNPSTLLTHICDVLASHKIHGIVFEDNVGTEAVAQILDFISSQTQVPIISISGGSAVVLSPKVRLWLPVIWGLGLASGGYWLGQWGFPWVSRQDLVSPPILAPRDPGAGCIDGTTSSCSKRVEANIWKAPPDAWGSGLLILTPSSLSSPWLGGSR